MPRQKVHSSQIADYNGAALTASGQFIPRVVSSTQIAVSSGSLEMADGTLYNFAGDTVNLPPLANGDGSWYIGIDPNPSSVVGNPFCKKIHAFRYRIHSCMIWVCRVSRTGSAVTITERYRPEWPRSAITRFKAKCAAASTGALGAPIRIAVLGTSLSNHVNTSGGTNVDGGSTTGTVNWYSMLFQTNVSSFPNGASYRIPFLNSVNARFEIVNLSMGSNNVHWHAAWVAEGIEGVSSSNVPNTAWAVRKDSMEKRNASSWKRLADSPLITEPYDLVIIDSIPNGGTHKMMHLDNIVRKLRARGTEIVFTRALQTNAGATVDLLDTFIPDLVRIANVRGCDIADWASFVWEAIDAISPRTDGVNAATSIAPLNDTIHPRTNRFGEGLHTEALRSVINDLPQLPRVPDASMMNRQLIYDTTVSSSLLQFQPTHYEFAAFPSSTSGTITYSAGTTAIYNPASGIPAGSKMPETAFGGKIPNTSADINAPVMLLGSGASVRFAHPFALGASILTEWDGTNAWTVNVTDGSTTITTLSQTSSSGSAKGFMLEGPQFTTTAGGWGAAQSSSKLAGPFNSHVLNINQVSGTPRIRGVLWHLPGEIEEVSTSRMRFVGTWATGLTANGGVEAVCAGTNADATTSYCEFSVVGRGVFIHLEQLATSGFVDVWVNGEKVITAQDTYLNGSFHGFLRVLPPVGMTYAGSPSAFLKLPELGSALRMNVRIAYTGTNNASAVAPSGNSYRLKICGASVIL